jgi:5-methylcytosine-specific restriction endonuclease McrA
VKWDSMRRKRKPHKKTLRRFRLKNYVAQAGCCAYCEQPMRLSDSTIDHLVPLSRGGSWRHYNLRLCCGPCNAAKGDLLPQDSEWTGKGQCLAEVKRNEIRKWSHRSA